MKITNEIINEITSICAMVENVRRSMTPVDFVQKFHGVAIIFMSPFGKLEHRQGWFDTFTEANNFIDRLSKMYLDNKIPFFAYLDNELMNKYWD